MPRLISTALCCLAGLFALLAARPAAAIVTPLPVSISAYDPDVYYIGRFDTRDPAGPRCSWSHSMATIRFTGTDIQLALTETGDDYLDVIVDNSPPVVVHPVKGPSLIYLGRGLVKVPHVVTVIKRTEAAVGTLQIDGFYVNAGAVLTPPILMDHKIELIGDSINVGYGDESPVYVSPYTDAKENATIAYGALTAEAENAEYVCISWSGRTLYPTTTPPDTLPSVYDLALGTDPTSAWDFGNWIPDVVLINLGSNDFATANPPEAPWCAAYEAFIEHVRGHYPNALIYIASGPTMNDAVFPKRMPLTTLNAYLAQIQSDLQGAREYGVRIIHFPIQDGVTDGFGAGFHPSARTHGKMAAQWAAALQADLGWQISRLP